MRYKTQIAVLTALVLAVSMWFYVQRVLIPHQKAEAKPRGNLSDLYPRWLGARELLLHHRDPYSAEVTHEIQIGYYGRPLDAGRSMDPKDQQAFVYPVYVVFLLAPTIHWQFAVVAECFRWLLIVLTGATVILWLRALRWRVHPAVAAVIIILTLGSYAAVQGIKLQQLTLLVSGLIAACVALVSTGHLLLAGILLALATVKPQLAAPLAGWLLLWSVSSWKSRQRLAWGFGVTLALLVGGGEIVLPGWIGRFQVALAAYRRYTGGSLVELLAGRALSTVVTGLLLFALAALCWKMRREPAESEAFGFCLVVVLAVTVLIIPMFAPYNQLLLLPGLLLALRYWKELGDGWPGRLVYATAAAVIGWQWLGSLALMLASVILPASALQPLWALPLYTIAVIPFIVMGVLGLVAIGFQRRRNGERGTAQPASLALPGASR